PGAQVGSRLEAVGEAEGPDLGLLGQVLGLRPVPGEIDGQVVERLQVPQGLQQEGVVGHGTGRRTRQGGSPPCRSLSACPGCSCTANGRASITPGQMVEGSVNRANEVNGLLPRPAELVVEPAAG